ncbi:hypothetical protein CC78DRAFT_434668, partial [Lojkania enalia]
LSCLCSAAKHKFLVPSDALPLPTNLCNCNISRRISGTLLTSYINISHYDGVPTPELTVLTPYKSSEILTRYFCSICGTQMYLEYNHDGHFEAATGTLQVDNTDGIIDFRSHMWIEDTLDGGASDFIIELNGRALKRYAQEHSHSIEVALDLQRPAVSESHGNQHRKVHAHCHCNGVQFYIDYPNDASKAAVSPWPDLLIPFHTGKSSNLSNYAWWLPRQDRYLAGTCSCNTCRQASGFDITFWAFIPTCNISQDLEGTRPFTRKSYWGTMKSFQSSEGVTRTFCGRCGANVFWDGRDSLIDVSVGLLDAPSGARAEELLAWWAGRVSFEEDALNQGLIRGLESGLKAWG